MIPPKYNFYLKKNNGDSISINPHYKSLSKKYSKENGQAFFRETIEGKITLHGKDYEVIANSDLEDKFLFIIEKYSIISSTWKEYFRGEFNKTDCSYDNDKKICELNISPIDDYTEILNNYENTYDLIKLAPQVTKINIQKRPLVQVYIRGANSITNLFGGTYWEEDVLEAVNSNTELQSTYHFSYIGTANEFYITNCKIAEVNGIYAGNEGVYSKWEPNYVCKLEPDTESGENYYKVNLYNQAGTLLYSSKSNIIDPDNGFFINPSPFTMTSVNDDTDSFIVNTVFAYHIYMRVLCNLESIELSDSEPLDTYPISNDDFANYSGSNYKRCIGIDSGFIFCTSRTVTTPTKYGINDNGEYFTNEFIPSSTGLGRPLPISRNAWANSSLWYVYNSSYNIMEPKLRTKTILKDSWSIGSIIKVLLGEIAPSITHEENYTYSTFLYGAMPVSPTNRFYVFLTQKSNVLKSNYDQAAQKAEISFKDIMDMLRDCFRCYWFIDNGKLRIEHISFFMRGFSYDTNTQGIQLDFTSLKDQFNKKLVSYFQSEVEYEKDDLAKRYEFGWMDDATELFDGVTIDVNSNYVQRDKNEEINVNNFSADIDFMMFNSSNFSQDGFALLCPVKDGNEFSLPIIQRNLVDENGDTYAATIQNFYASWLHLVNFYMYDMPAFNITCNAMSLYVYSIKMCKKLEIEFPLTEDPDLYQLIKTPMGNGRIDEMSINIDTRVIKVKLAFMP